MHVLSSLLDLDLLGRVLLGAILQSLLLNFVEGLHVCVVVAHHLASTLVEANCLIP